MQYPLYKFISGLFRHTSPDIIEETEYYVSQYLPSGSGFNSGSRLDTEKSTPEKLVFTTAFQHMDDHGYYTRWTEHTVTVTPSFFGLDIKVSGRNHRDIKDYIAECFDHVLNEQVGDGLRKKYTEIMQAVPVRYPARA